MNYKIIPDANLNANALMETSDVIYSASEIPLLKKSPFTWHLISDEKIEKTPAFYLDAGYFSYQTIIVLDTVLKSQLAKKSLAKITTSDLNLDDKIKDLNKLSLVLNLPTPDFEGATSATRLYQLKMQGFFLANYCQDQLNSHLDFEASRSLRSEKFNHLIPFVELTNADLALIKGTYVNYIESNKTSKLPKDVDLVLVIDNLYKEYYLGLMESSITFDEIKCAPMIIPMQYLDGCTFFDLDINKNTIFLHGQKRIYLPKHPEQFIPIEINAKIRKLRELLVDNSALTDHLENNPIKIISATRSPNRIYERLVQLNLHSGIKEPENKYYNISNKTSLIDAKRFLADASLELSDMGKAYRAKYELM